MPQFDMLQNIQCLCIDGAPGFSDHRLLRMQTSYCTELAETSTGPEIAPLVHGSGNYCVSFTAIQSGR